MYPLYSYCLRKLSPYIPSQKQAFLINEIINKILIEIIRKEYELDFDNSVKNALIEDISRGLCFSFVLCASILGEYFTLRIENLLNLRSKDSKAYKEQLAFFTNDIIFNFADKWMLKILFNLDSDETIEIDQRSFLTPNKEKNNQSLGFDFDYGYFDFVLFYGDAPKNSPVIKDRKIHIYKYVNQDVFVLFIPNIKPEKQATRIELSLNKDPDIYNVLCETIQFHNIYSKNLTLDFKDKFILKLLESHSNSHNITATRYETLKPESQKKVAINTFYIDDLQKFLEKTKFFIQNKKVIVEMSACGHVCALDYDPNNNFWLLYDSNSGLGIEKLPDGEYQEVAKKIQQYFFKKAQTIIVTFTSLDKNTDISEISIDIETEKLLGNRSKDCKNDYALHDIAYNMPCKVEEIVSLANESENFGKMFMKYLFIEDEGFTALESIKKYAPESLEKVNQFISDYNKDKRRLRLK